MLKQMKTNPKTKYYHNHSIVFCFLFENKSIMLLMWMFPRFQPKTRLHTIYLLFSSTVKVSIHQHLKPNDVSHSSIRNMIVYTSISPFNSCYDLCSSTKTKKKTTNFVGYFYVEFFSASSSIRFYVRHWKGFW